MRYAFLIFTTILLGTSSVLFSAIRYVSPSGVYEYTVIQQAINASANGDTVIVNPGRYNENLVIMNKRITLASVEMVTGNRDYINQTIIDGMNLEGCIVVHGHPSIGDPPTVIRGFTLTKGLGTRMVNKINDSRGGGIRASGTKLIIINNHIYGNNAEQGGGILAVYSEIHLAGNSIHDNKARGQGGGISIQGGSGPFIIDENNLNSIYNNISSTGSDISFYTPLAPNNIYADTISVFNPSIYYAAHFVIPYDNVYLPLIVNANHACYTEENRDFYVAPWGNDDNDGSSFASPMKTIVYAARMMAADSLNPKTLYLAPGEYRQSEGQIFPIQIKGSSRLIGSGRGNTIIIPDARIFNTFCVQTTDARNIRISDLSIDGENNPGFNGIAITGNHPNANVIIENVSFQNVVSTDDLGNSATFGIVGTKNFLITNCSVSGSRSNGSGGLYIHNSSGIIENSIFKNNTGFHPNPGSVVFSSDLYAALKNDTLLIRNCEFIGGNYNHTDPEALYGNITIKSEGSEVSSHTRIENCLFINNHSEIDATLAFKGNAYSSMDVINCTFTGNTSRLSTAVFRGQMTRVLNCIFSNPTFYEVMPYYPTETWGFAPRTYMDYNCIPGGFSRISHQMSCTWDEHNIDVNPFFKGEGELYPYSLQADSPCIDNGSPEIDLMGMLPFDLAGSLRFWNGRIDMGCYEYGSPAYVSSDDPELPAPEPGLSLLAYPNPFNPRTTLAFNLPQPGLTQIEIYNLKGQKVKTLHSGYLPQGRHQLSFGGTDDSGRALSSGIYFARISQGKASKTIKLILMK
ncbi:MAG: T9SS type A sorting domain-containing protein [Candidatus Cloacimonetes bacterium]|nr:T9SS type A sorting domain-containing protein [Candidatus Cloacimonadota bacterium]